PNPPLEGEGDCHVLPLKGRETVKSAIWHVTHYKPHRAEPSCGDLWHNVTRDAVSHFSAVDDS
ncbi:MAG: hypothetical protein Q8O31_08930, partial [Rhodocyclaceae bacterium]|nr:hypothetical protein [Rhodocyclaceae bacterium]